MGVMETPICGTHSCHAPARCLGFPTILSPVYGLTFGEHQECMRQGENPRFLRGASMKAYYWPTPMPTSPHSTCRVCSLCDDVCPVWLHAGWVSEEKRRFYRRQPAPRGEVRAPVPALGDQGGGALHQLGLLQEGQRGPGGAGSRRCRLEHRVKA